MKLLWDDLNCEACAEVASYGNGIVVLYADGESGCAGEDWYEVIFEDNNPLTLESIAHATQLYKQKLDREYGYE